jgi:hypothetical protein
MDPCLASMCTSQCWIRNHSCCQSRRESPIAQQSLSQGQATAATHLDDCHIGGLFAPHTTPAFPSSINQFGNSQLLMELKFKLNTGLTDWCVIAVACAYGFATVSIALNSIPLALVNAVVLLAILFVLFGLQDILTRKPTAAIR